MTVKTLKPWLRRSAMKTIRYTIKTINPVIISQTGSDQNMRNTKTYINGNTILGLVAKKYIKENNLDDNAQEDKNFKKLFLNGDIIYTNAYLTDDDYIYYPSPLSFKQEKYNENKIYNMLFVDEDFDTQTKSISEYLKINKTSILKSSVKKKISFHHARERKTGITKKGAIFNYESISPGQLFTGHIIGNEENIHLIKDLIPNSYVGYVGRSKNTEYGKIKFNLSEIKEYKREINTGFNPDEKPEEPIVMTFLSDTIIYNENGFSCTNVNELGKILNISIKKSFINHEREEKYVGIWRCKNQSETCFKAGSTFLLNTLPNNYSELEQNGIGERTHEGFGRVIFGYQNGREHEGQTYSVVNNLQNEEKSKPGGTIPDIVKEITIEIITEKMNDLTVKKAMETADKFHSIPSNSLIGKLHLISKDVKTFKENFEKIKNNKPAQQQLEKCNNNNQTLAEFLHKNNFISENDFNGNKPIENLLKIEALDITLSHLLEKRQIKLNKIYLETFLKSLKWKNNQEKGGK